MIVGHTYTFKEVLKNVDKEAYACHSIYSFRETPLTLCAKCRHCKCKFIFDKEGYQFKLKSQKTHSEETLHSNIKIGQPSKESVIRQLQKRFDPSMKQHDICMQVCRKFGTAHLSMDRVRTILKSTFYRGWDLSWKCLPDYINKLKNMSINADIEYTDEARNIIKYVYIELPYATKLSTSTCMPRILLLDGTFLSKRSSKSELLIISAISSEHIALPLAALICDGENKNSYRYFFVNALIWLVIKTIQSP